MFNFATKPEAYIIQDPDKLDWKAVLKRYQVGAQVLKANQGDN